MTEKNTNENVDLRANFAIQEDRQIESGVGKQKYAGPRSLEKRIPNFRKSDFQGATHVWLQGGSNTILFLERLGIHITSEDTVRNRNLTCRPSFLNGEPNGYVLFPERRNGLEELRLFGPEGKLQRAGIHYKKFGHKLPEVAKAALAEKKNRKQAKPVIEATPLVKEGE